MSTQDAKFSQDQLDQLTDQIVTALKTVFDPEIPVDIYELGLIYKVDVSDDMDITVDMTLTAPGCPVAGEMPGCDFLYHTATSHEIIDMLRNRQLDLGITTSPLDRHGELHETPLLRDPFVLVLPGNTDHALPDITAGGNKLPFLRFSSELIIAQQIEAQLRRLGIVLDGRSRHHCFFRAPSGFTGKSSYIRSPAKAFRVACHWYRRRIAPPLCWTLSMPRYAPLWTSM